MPATKYFFPELLANCATGQSAPALGALTCLSRVQTSVLEGRSGLPDRQRSPALFGRGSGDFKSDDAG